YQVQSTRRHSGKGAIQRLYLSLRRSRGAERVRGVSRPRTERSICGMGYRPRRRRRSPAHYQALAEVALSSWLNAGLSTNPGDHQSCGTIDTRIHGKEITICWTVCQAKTNETAGLSSDDASPSLSY